MTGIAVDRAAPMTRYLAAEADVFRHDAVIIVDVGARRGSSSQWASFGARLYCSEADKEACRRLNTLEYRHTLVQVAYCKQLLKLGHAPDRRRARRIVGISASLLRSHWRVICGQGELPNVDAAVRKAQTQLSRIYSSRSWPVNKPLRQLGSLFRHQP